MLAKVQRHIRTQTLRAVYDGLAHVAVLEEHGRLDFVPLLAGERINSALLLTLTLGELLVLANSHSDKCSRR